jgi:hypothetical protein
MQIQINYKNDTHSTVLKVDPDSEGPFSKQIEDMARKLSINSAVFVNVIERSGRVGSLIIVMQNVETLYVWDVDGNEID